MDRRQFLYAIAVGSAATACAKKTGTSGGSSAPASVSLATPKPPSGTLPLNLFSLGVASGDPTHDRVILWTRLVSDPLTHNQNPLTEAVEVAYDVATDAEFSSLIVSGVATATPELGHSVHVDVTGLDANSWYYYRFRIGNQVSPVGHTRTFPPADQPADRLKFVFASCQDFQWGTFVLWNHASQEADLDAVVFLGDYIYELNLGDLSPNKDGSRVWKSPTPETLSDYRSRYAQTKTDAMLQKAHAAAPWLVTFDDHEVSNNYAGDVGQGDINQPKSKTRRLAAYQAWYEHTPIRLDPNLSNFDDLIVHRNFTFGSLANLILIETRQHADAPPCRTATSGMSDDGPDCAEREDPKRTNLGETQEQWLTTTLTTSDTTWNVLCNPLMFSTVNIGTKESPQFTRDTWDGYPLARDRLIDTITSHKVSNPVIVTGDWHASFVLDVRKTPDGPSVMPEFVGSSITTLIFGTDYRPANPQIKYFADKHCYCVATVTPDSFTCAFKYVDDVWNLAAPISTVDSFVVKAGSPSVERA